MTGTLARPDAANPGMNPEPSPGGSGADWASDPRFDSVIHRRPNGPMRIHSH